MEKRKPKKTTFTGELNPVAICETIAAIFRTSITPGKTLLFLDEIQSCPEAITSLRFFYEKMPDLHVIAAGSLLEFALAEIPTFGVGRIRSLFMYPMSFSEFLSGAGEQQLLDIISESKPGRTVRWT